MSKPTESAPLTRASKRRFPSPHVYDSSPRPSPKAFSNSKEFWYDDGNIILDVQTTHFRVHQSFLAGNSCYFDDLLKVPQPEFDAMMDPCRTVRLLDDAAEDWEHLFMVMYHPLNIDLTAWDLETKYLVAMLRLGKKYQFSAIYVAALARLRLELPQTLEDYDALYNIPHTDAREEYIYTPKKYRLMTADTSSLFDLTNIADELKIYSVLPTAFYFCAKLQSEEIISARNPYDNSGATSQLSRDNQCLVLEGRDRIRSAIMDHIAGWVFRAKQSKISIPDARCSNQQRCKETLHDTALALARQLNWDISYGLSTYRDATTEFISKFCPTCLGIIKKHHADERKEWWDGLPWYFNLPKWENLAELEVLSEVPDI